MVSYVDRVIGTARGNTVLHKDRKGYLYLSGRCYLCAFFAGPFA